MSKLFLYNTLTRKKEEFKALKKNEVGLYTCGPTVYNFAHLGNLRTYLFEDFLKRTLEYNGYKVNHVMNITDVGHLTGDMDMGEDKVEKVFNVCMKCTNCGRETRTQFNATEEAFSSMSFLNIFFPCEHCGANNEIIHTNGESNLYLKKFKNTALEITEFYFKSFKKDLALLNIEKPTLYCKATDNISEQIDLIKVLEKKSYTYRISDGLYFDTSRVKDYNKLSHLPLKDLKEGARVEKNPEKKNPTDFALWKFSPAGAQRQMEWPSPWGTGFPGWHIECSAMSLKYLAGELDIHCGGIDHINIHHTNEIAQSEAATGKKFFNYWLHGAFLNIRGGKKMAKSEDNFLTLESALVQRGISPLAYRFAALQVHYRKPMEYSEEILRQAETGLDSLLGQVAKLGEVPGQVSKDWQEKFLAAVNDDLNMPKALAVLAGALKAKLSPADKLATILEFDKVLGLNLDEPGEELEPEITFENLPVTIKELLNSREAARVQKNWAEADRLRREIEEQGYFIEDMNGGQKVKRLN